MKTYKNGVGLTDDLQKLIDNTNKEALPQVMNEFVKDCNEQHLAPRLTGALQETLTYGIDKQKGIIMWLVVYARRRYYEGSISGVPLWAEVCKRRNKNDYIKLIKKVFEEEKRKL